MNLTIRKVSVFSWIELAWLLLAPMRAKLEAIEGHQFYRKNKAQIDAELSEVTLAAQRAVNFLTSTL